MSRFALGDRFDDMGNGLLLCQQEGLVAGTAIVQRPQFRGFDVARNDDGDSNRKWGQHLSVCVAHADHGTFGNAIQGRLRIFFEQPCYRCNCDELSALSRQHQGGSGVKGVVQAMYPAIGKERAITRALRLQQACTSDLRTVN